MNIGDINTYVSFRANTDTTQYSAANRLISTNRWMHKVWSMILASQDEWDVDDINTTATYPTATRALAARRDYAFSTALWQLIGKEGGAAGSAAAINPLKIKRVDVSYDGSTYVPVTPIDEAQIDVGLGNDTNTDAAFSRTTPRYDIRDNSLWLYPAPLAADVTAGGKLRITIQREPLEFSSAEVTTGTKEPGFDEAFHVMVALGMIFDWCSAKGGTSPVLSALKRDAWTELQDYEVRLKQYYGSKQLDRHYALGSAFDDSYGS